MKFNILGKEIEIRSAETQKLSDSPSNWYNTLFGNSSISGEKVNEDTALTYSAVYSCIRVLSEALAQLPLKVYTNKNGYKTEAKEHPLYKILHDRPNDETSSFNWRETAMLHLLTYGNSYSYIEYDNKGNVSGIYIIRPDRVTVRRDSKTSEIVYDIVTNDGLQKTYNKNSILHIPAIGFDGIVGYSPIKLASNTIGLGLSATKSQSSFFSNGSVPAGVISHPAKLSKEAAEKLRNSWETAYGGSSNSHKTAILEEGMEYKTISISAADAQLLEQMKYNRTEICGIYRVPPHMIGDLSGATFSNIEQQSLEFVIYTLTPWLVRFEQNINYKLFLPAERNNYYAEFVVDGLLRGDIESRHNAHQSAINSGWKSINEIRAEENLAPVDNGDTHLVQGAMVSLKTVANNTTTDNFKGGEKVNNEKGN